MPLSSSAEGRKPSLMPPIGGSFPISHCPNHSCITKAFPLIFSLKGYLGSKEFGRVVVFATMAGKEVASFRCLEGEIWNKAAGSLHREQ